MPRQFHKKKIIEKLFFYRFLMNFQRLEFSDDIQPMFVSVLAGWGQLLSQVHAPTPSGGFFAMFDF